MTIFKSKTSNASSIVTFLTTVMGVYFYMVYRGWVDLPTLSWDIDPTAVALDMEHLTHNTSILDTLNLTTTGKMKLNGVVQFIEELKATLPSDDLVKISNLNWRLHDVDVALPYPLYAGNNSIGIQKNLLDNELYTVEELKAGVAHELGHILMNHFSLVHHWMNILYHNHYVVLPVLLAPYLQQNEFEADSMIITLNADPCAAISFLEKALSEGSETFWYKLATFIDNIRPIPLEYRSSHPSTQRRAMALNVSANCTFFPMEKSGKLAEDVCQSEQASIKSST